MADIIKNFKIRVFDEITQTYKYMYPETSGEQVKLSDGTTVETHVADTEKHIAPEERISWNGKEDAANKGEANGYASLGADGKIPSSQLPAVAITNSFPVNSLAEMLALSVEIGDVCVRTDENKSYILRAEPATIFDNWLELLSPPNAVVSVNGQIGAVNLTTSDIAEGNKKYYTDERVSENPDVVAAKTHAESAHAPADAQKNSDITKEEIEDKLTGVINSHRHANQIIITNDIASVTPQEGQIVFEVI